MATKASREAFLELVNSGKRDTRNLKIYDCIKAVPGATIPIIMRDKYLSKSSVGAGLSELSNMGVIKVRETIQGFSLYVIVTDPLEQLQLSQSRAKARVVKALKVLIKEKEVLSPENDFIDYVKWELAILEE